MAAADASVLLTHITTSGITVAFLNWLKSTSLFPWITAEKTKLLRVLAIALAGVKAIGITYTWNPETHSLVIGGLTLTVIVGGVWHWAQSFVTQELIYQTTKNKTSSAASSSSAALPATASTGAPLPSAGKPSVTDSANPVAPAAKLP